MHVAFTADIIGVGTTLGEVGGVLARGYKHDFR